MSLLTCYCSLHLYRAIKLLVSYCYYFLPYAAPPWDNEYKTALKSTKKINTCVLLIRHGHGDISRVLDTRQQLWSWHWRCGWYVWEITLHPLIFAGNLQSLAACANNRRLLTVKARHCCCSECQWHYQNWANLYACYIWSVPLTCCI